MEFGLFKITTATTTTLIAKGQKAGNVKSVRITNAHDTSIIFVSLFLDDDTNQTYFFKKNILYPGQSIFLDSGVSFNNAALGLKLTTTTAEPSHGVSVNVIVK
tara:strand:+ start:65 stop:373 length:309 start_codon:yes stop_codon:yes gene_type:complete